MGIKCTPEEIERLEKYSQRIQKTNWTRYDKIQEALTGYSIKFG